MCVPTSYQSLWQVLGIKYCLKYIKFLVSCSSYRGYFFWTLFIKSCLFFKCLLNHDFFSPHHSVKIDLIVFANDTLLTKCMGYIYVLIVFNGYEFDIVERLLCFLKNVLNLISFILKQYSYHMCAFFLSFSSSTCFLNDHVVIRDFSKLFTLSLCV